jgi:hypothetical protein
MRRWALGRACVALSSDVPRPLRARGEALPGRHVPLIAPTRAAALATLQSVWT